MEKIYAGSVKDLYLFREKGIEYVLMKFTDCFSVFDIGRMPNTIPGKGKNLARFSKYIYEALNKTFKTSCADHLKTQEDEIILRYFKAYKPVLHNEVYDYHENTAHKNNKMIPLECIFRYGVPQGSSLIKRGYQPNTIFDEPLVEFTTKYEKKDRLLTLDEAFQISGIERKYFDALIEYTKEISLFLKDLFEKKQLRLWDGKFEFAIDEHNNILLADVITPDELRMDLDGEILSKQLLRNFCKEKNTLTPEEIEKGAKLYRKAAKVMTGRKNVLIIGSAGREHAMGVSCKKSKDVLDVYVYPGNPGMKHDGLEVLQKTSAHPFEEILSFIKQYEIDSVIPGGEEYLAQGIVDFLTSKNIPVFGPTKYATQLESSKSFAKNVLNEVHAHTARAEIVENLQTALAALAHFKTLPVIKLDGLAQGKGVFLPETKEEVTDILQKLYSTKSNEKILLEERLQGHEISIFAIADGSRYSIIGTAADYKRKNENDLGPNTGGMGAISPHPLWSSAESAEALSPPSPRLRRASASYSLASENVVGGGGWDENLKKQSNEIFKKVLTHMEKTGHSYKGFLYCGGMIVDGKLYVLEFNARLGDPETQVLLNTFSYSLYDIIESFQNNALSEINAQEHATVITIADKNYPEKTSESHAISFEEFHSLNTHYFMAGVIEKEGKLYTSGGRVLYATGWDKTLALSITHAYRAADHIKFEGKYIRKDIGKKWTT